jgi:hypothetical protein
MPDMSDKRLGIYPTPMGLLSVWRRPDEPFVMLNLLAFKEQATGDYRGMSGAEAYGLYGESVAEIQGTMGSRMLWAGQVTERLDPTSPSFDVVVFLEYAHPSTFLRFALRGGSRTDARRAGLSGQWLLASTTHAHTPDIGSPVLVELLDGPPWVEDGQIVWSGICDRRMIGNGPTVTHAVATVFTDDAAFAAGIEQRRLTRPGTISTWWSYRATPQGIDDRLR